jgi:transcriptional regulator with XRE-family HTH domain
MTQERLALNAGLDRSFYVDVENGHHSLTVERLFAIADALGTPAHRLLAGID